MVRILQGDCVEQLQTLPEASIDAVVTDPPYDLTSGKRGGSGDASMNVKSPAGRSRIGTGGGFMGLAWDGTGIAFWPETWAAVLRVMKPGAHLLAFGGTRTYHRMASAIEDAGFEIRDVIAWLYGSGFPKSLNLGEGLGTALKPAHEPIVLARKPFKGSVTANVQKHGTGALNIDACRIEADGRPLIVGDYKPTADNVYEGRQDGSLMGGSRHAGATDVGRWPANVVIDDLAALVIDEQSGESASQGGRIGNAGGGNVQIVPTGRFEAGDPGYGDVGGASRYFYCAKPSREERDYGLEGFKRRSSFETVSRDPMSAGANNPRAGAGRTSLLDTSEIVYPEPSWVDAVLRRRLQPDTDTLRGKATTGRTTRCSDGSAWSMCWCGSLSTDPYHPAVRSIIETETSSITESRISSSSRRLHTNGCIAAAFGVMADGGNLAAYAEFQSPWRRHIGISPKKDGHSTDDVDLVTSIESWLISRPENGGGRRVEAARNFHPT